jgi:hypothetical protein
MTKKRILFKLFESIENARCISSQTLRSIANGSRECAPDDRLRDASRRMKPLNRKMLLDLHPPGFRSCPAHNKKPGARPGFGLKR